MIALCSWFDDDTTDAMTALKSAAFAAHDAARYSLSFDDTAAAKATAAARIAALALFGDERAFKLGRRGGVAHWKGHRTHLVEGGCRASGGWKVAECRRSHGYYGGAAVLFRDSRV